MTLERKLIEQQKWLYHISSLENLESILTQGLLSRSNLRLNERTFNDVADPEIIEGRSHTGLDQYVPFHFSLITPSMEGYKALTATPLFSIYA